MQNFNWHYKMDGSTNYARIYMFPDSTDSLRGYCGESNARLVACAPELLDALIAADGLLAELNHSLPNVKAVINKAKSTPNW